MNTQDSNVGMRLHSEHQAKGHDCQRPLEEQQTARKARNVTGHAAC